MTTDSASLAFEWGIHRDRWIPRTKGQLCGALIFSLICVWINGWVNNREAGDLRRHRGHYDVIVMLDRPCTFYLCDSMKRISFYMTPQYQPVPIKICLCTLFSSRFVIRTKLPVYTSSNVLFSMYDMFTSFSFFVQSLRIFCDAGQCIFSVAHPSYETGVISSIPAWSTIIYRFLCGFICVSLCQSIKIEPTNMYIASARAQFKINTHRCWNWHHVHSRHVVSCPVQPRARHWSCVFLARFQWREAYVLDNWQLVELPQSGGRKFDPRLVHDNLSVPLWVYMRFPVPEHQNWTNKYDKWWTKNKPFL